MSLACLTVLSIRLWEVKLQAEHLDKLAELPSLRVLSLHLGNHPAGQEKLTIHGNPSAFPCLTDLRISCTYMFLKFQPGAMQKLRLLNLNFDAEMTISYYQTDDFYYGIENLLSLRQLFLPLPLKNEYTEAVYYAIWEIIDDHPNHPSVEFFIR